MLLEDSSGVELWSSGAVLGVRGAVLGGVPGDAAVSVAGAVSVLLDGCSGSIFCGSVAVLGVP